MASFALGAAALAMGAAGIASVQPIERAAIAKLRAANNQAIAAHDIDATMAIVGDDYVVIAGEGGIFRGEAEVRKIWQTSFSTPGFDRYVRTPASISIGAHDGVLRAAESGTWYGLAQHREGPWRPQGRYFAHWLKHDGKWQLVAEVFVTLGCTGKGC